MLNDSSTLRALDRLNREVQDYVQWHPRYVIGFGAMTLGHLYAREGAGAIRMRRPFQPNLKIYHLIRIHHEGSLGFEVQFGARGWNTNEIIPDIQGEWDV